MDSKRNEQIESVIGRHLNLIDSDEAGQQGQVDPGDQRIESALGKTLAPLESWRVAEPPAELNRRILARIESLEKTISFEDAAALQPEAATGRRGGWYFSVRDLVAAAACIILTVGLFVPGYRGARTVIDRNACQSNMTNLYAGMAGFAQQNNNQLPNVAQPAKSNWMPNQERTAQPGNNARNLYVLFKMGYVKNARVFICPARPNDVALNRGDYRSLDNFPSQANVSYSIQNMAGPFRITFKKTDPNMVIVGDANPLFDTDVVQSLLGGPINSSVHGKAAGQNVLYVSGRVVFAKESTCGVQGDDIWRAGDLTKYTGTEVPQCATDTFLIP